jgi:hypothetical protein
LGKANGKGRQCEALAVPKALGKAKAEEVGEADSPYAYFPKFYN